ncbi:TWiK family of potassium channels protein 7-like, partial [Photinus pyralis]
MDMKTRLKAWCFDFRIKQALAHAGLFITLMAYTVLGGLIFRYLEHPAEVDRLTNLHSSLVHRRRHFVERIINNTLVLENPLEYVFYELSEYEKLLEDAFAEGFQSSHEQEITELEKWSFVKSVFFSSTILTTIGYGNTVPVTTEGRAFCIVFALIGIPLTLTVIADLGRLFASSLSTFMDHLPRCCRTATAVVR